MAACTQKENPVEERTPVALQYTTVDATETKAAQNLNEGTFATGETVKVRISNTGAGEWTDYDFTTGSTGAMSPASTVPYYPAGTQNIDIVAYYPSTAGTSFTVASDQTADADYKASDLMFASVTNQAKQAEAVNLAFTHKLAKINVNVTVGTGVSTISSVSLLNVKPTVLFDQATGAVGEASGDATSIAMSNEGAVLIPAQTITGGLFSIVTDKGTATYSVPNGKAFDAGQQYTLNITVNLRAIGTTTAINGWTSEGTVAVDSGWPQEAGHEYVDMGEGLYWATCNLGASDPWEFGDHLAWGAILPNYQYGYSEQLERDNSCTHWLEGKSGYDWASYPFMAAGYADQYHITKYTNDDGVYFSDLEKYWYSPDGEFIGDAKIAFFEYNYEDDAARQRWGTYWRVPDSSEWDHLTNPDNYSWVWTLDYLGTGKCGYLVTRLNGPCAGNFIFLPAAGHWYGVNKEEDGICCSPNDACGYYWSSECPGQTHLACLMYFDHSKIECSKWDRCWGLSIRPVTEYLSDPME